MKTPFAVWAVALVLTALVFVPQAAGAEDASQKFTRGALNTTTGWVEFPQQVIHQSSENIYQGATYGALDGLSLGLKRTLYGAWDWATFAIPPYDKPKMEPETVFGATP